MRRVALIYLLLNVSRLALGSGFRVFPNPWKANNNPPPAITFDSILPESEVKIYTISAHWIRTVKAVNGTATWDLKNDKSENVASGYYLFILTDSEGNQQNGKLAVIR